VYLEQMCVYKDSLSISRLRYSDDSEIHFRFTAPRNVEVYKWEWERRMLSPSPSSAAAIVETI